MRHSTLFLNGQHPELGLHGSPLGVREAVGMRGGVGHNRVEVFPYSEAPHLPETLGS